MGNVQLFQNDNPVEIEHYADGAAVVIKPTAVKEANQYGTTTRHSAGLDYSSENDPTTYTLEIGSGVSDLAGNTITSIT